MSAEWVTAIATAGTFLVIAASAVAALVQLRHMRGSNQILALTELRETMESPEFQARIREVYGPFQERLQDEAFLKRVHTERWLMNVPEYESALIVGNFFESAGCLVKNRIVDPDIFCDLWAGVVIGSWNALAPFIYADRHKNGSAVYENFEYLVVIAEQFDRRHPDGTYPKGLPRKSSEPGVAAHAR